MMKKLPFPLMLILVLVLVFPGAVLGEYTEEPEVFDLIVGDGRKGVGLDVGDLAIWNDTDTLYVEYSLTDPSWCLLETHLQVGLSLEDIPQKNGNPVPGLFEYSDMHVCANEMLYAYSLAESGWVLDDTLFVAAHALVVHTSGTIGSAWAAGFDFSGKSWATYTNYVVQGKLDEAWPIGGTMTAAFEDLPPGEGNDYDYNDWVIDIDTQATFWGTSADHKLEKISFAFRPEARGAGYDHAFHLRLPADTFACDGTFTLQKWDRQGNMVEDSAGFYSAALDNEFLIVPWTRVALPDEYDYSTNTNELVPYTFSNRYIELSIRFDYLCEFDFEPFDPTNPANFHGEGLFFDPWLLVIPTGDEVHRGDPRMLVTPVDWAWPEEEVSIWEAYPYVTPGSPPTFADGWFAYFTEAIYTPPTGTIAGTVYETDGVTPIAGVHVDACPNGEGYCVGADTGVAGEYLIAGLPPTGLDYTVFVWGQPGWAGEVYEETFWWADPTPVAIGSSGINFTLDPGGSISGYVYDAVTGDPLANIGVDLPEGNYGACTEEDGSFTMWGLPYGTHEIVAGRDFCGPHPYMEEYHIGIVIDSDTPDVGGEIFNLVVGGAISGNVRADGVGVGDVWVDACLWDGSYCRGSGTDGSGDYMITGLPGGEYRVSVWGEQGGWIDEYWQETPFYDDAAPVTVTLGLEESGIDFTMETGGTISGIVLDDTTSIIPDRIDVSACVYTMDWLCWWTTVGEDGSYTITGLPDGDYRVHAYPIDNPYWLDEYYLNTRDWNAAFAVGIGTIKDVTGIDFQLTQGGAISGNVSADSTGLSDLWVQACLSDDSFCRWVQTNADGDYMAMALLPGAYRISVTGQGGWLDEYYVDAVHPEDATLVGVIAGGTVWEIDFVLVTGGMISGTVLDDTSGVIPDRIDVSACLFPDLAYCWWTTVNSTDGSYLLSGIPGGSYLVNTYPVDNDNWQGEYYNNVLDPAQATMVSVALGLETGSIDFNLSPYLAPP